MPEKIKILLIEDVPEDIAFVKIQLNKSFGDAYTCQVCDYFSKSNTVIKD